MECHREVQLLFRSMAAAWLRTTAGGGHSQGGSGATELGPAFFGGDRARSS